MIAASLSAENISWAPKGKGAPLVHPTSFEVAAGSVLGIVGPNGAGKSTILRMLYRYYAPRTGQIKVGGADIWAMPPREAARKVAAVLQEQPSSFGLTVRDVVALGRTPHVSGLAAGRGRDEAVVERCLADMDLTALAERDLFTLSGGERQRVMVARALAQEPRVLILDEPTNHLDIRHQLEVLAMIRALDLTIVVSLHDLNKAAECCDQILIMDRGHPLAHGSAAEVLTEDRVSSAFRVTAQREHLMPSGKAHFSFHLPDTTDDLR